MSNKEFLTYENIERIYNALKDYCINNDASNWTIGDADYYTKYNESFCDFYIFPKNGQNTTCLVTIFECQETSSKTEVYLELYAIPTTKKPVGHTILGSLPPDFYMGVNKHVLGEKLYRVINKTYDKLKQRMLD